MTTEEFLAYCTGLQEAFILALAGLDEKGKPIKIKDSGSFRSE